MKVFTGIVAISSAITFIIELNTCKSPIPKNQKCKKAIPVRKNINYNADTDSLFQEYKVSKRNLKSDSTK